MGNKDHLSEDDFWSSEDVLLEVHTLMENHGAFRAPIYHTVDSRTIGSTVFHGNLTNCTIQLTIPNVEAAVSLLSASLSAKEDSSSK